MNTTENLKLIEGNFSVNEAREILNGIFCSKINFHKIENLSSHVGFGKEDETAQKKIFELKEEMEKLKKILLEGKAKSKRVAINSEIVISLSED